MRYNAKGFQIQARQIAANRGHARGPGRVWRALRAENMRRANGGRVTS